MIKRLCDHIYEVVEKARLTETERAEIYHVISRYIIHLSDGFEIRRYILKYNLGFYYYNEPYKLQEKIEIEYLLWRCVWDIIYRDSYTQEGIAEAAKFFNVNIDDVLFIINNIYQKDIKIIQGLHYNPRKNFELFDPVSLLNSIKPNIIKLVKRRMRFLYAYDPGHTMEDFVSMAIEAAFRGFRKYDGKCLDVKDAEKKMFFCAKSAIMDLLNNPKTEDTKRIVEADGGYTTRVLSLDVEYDEASTLYEYFVDEKTLHGIRFNEYIKEIERKCKPEIVRYIKDVVFGQKDIGKDEKGYYKKLRQKYGINKKQVRKEVNKIINGKE